jgi:hypothetical protein
LIATWGTGAGDVAMTVAELSPSSTTDQGVNLAHALTELSRCVWRCYTHPATGSDTKVDRESRRREEDRKALSQVVPAIKKPYLPDEDGSITVCYNAILESANDVGRALHALTDAGVASAVITDVEHELEAIHHAECGQLFGRACQAVLLTRPSHSPVQVAGANRVFHEHPCGTDELFTRFDPTSAAVAAAHWLYAAARVAGKRSETPLDRVIFEAHAVEALNTETPARVLGLLEAGLTPHRVVTHLVREAMHAGEGVIVNPKHVISTIRKAARFKARYGGSDPIRITPLDPLRPARDLLADLIDGIRGCWLLYEESAYPADGDESELVDEADDDERDRAVMRALRARFEDEVRAEAAAHDALLVK